MAININMYLYITIYFCSHFGFEIVLWMYCCWYGINSFEDTFMPRIHALGGRAFYNDRIFMALEMPIIIQLMFMMLLIPSVMRRLPIIQCYRRFENC